jgi:multiple sugar transport system substrate-binding protein
MPAFNKAKIQQAIVEPVQKKFSNVTIEVMDQGPNQDAMFDKLVTAGTIPDFMLINYNSVRIIKSNGIALDLTSLIKSNNVDVNRFAPRAIEYLKHYGKHNELYALPYFLNMNTLSYNKDIFDKFGASYPKDGMTWDQFAELAKKVTRSADGVNYLGFNPNRPYTVAPQLSLDVVDAKTNKSAINSDGWKKVFQLFQDIYAIPGNTPAKVDDMWQGGNSFYKNQNLAMNLLWWDQTVRNLQEQQDSGKVINWDMVTAPVFKENPKLGQWLDQFEMAMSAQGKHQKETFQVINYLTSKEYQLDLSKDGYISSLNDQAIKDSLGANLPFMKGKNVSSLFKLDYAVPPTPRKFNSNAIINPYYKGILYDHKDINTTLRELDEKLNQAIQENQ